MEFVNLCPLPVRKLSWEKLSFIVRAAKRKVMKSPPPGHLLFLEKQLLGLHGLFAGPTAMLWHKINLWLWVSCFSLVLHSAPHPVLQLEERNMAALPSTPPKLSQKDMIPGVYPHSYGDTSGKKLGAGRNLLASSTPETSQFGIFQKQLMWVGD